MPLFRGNRKFYVYVYRDPRPRKKLQPFYVGKGCGQRADQHWKSGKPSNHLNKLFRTILEQIISAGLAPLIEIVAWFDDEEEAFDYEKKLIAKFGRSILRNGPLCNLTEGGRHAPKFARRRKPKGRLPNGRRAPTERLKRLDHGATSFSRWRATVGLLQDEAAKALLVSVGAVRDYESGRITPPKPIRALMRMVADKRRVPTLSEIWPE